MRPAAFWLAVFVLAVSAAAEEPLPRFHTSPYCWSGPRIFSDPREPLREVKVERWEEAAERPELISPNGAYAASWVRPEPVEGGTLEPELRIYNERPYLLRVVFPEAHAVRDPVWINEQLLYVRVWWGRIAGADFILDVEREEIVLRAPFTDGGIAFQQFQQCGEPEWRDREMCRCPASPGEDG